MPSAPHSLVRIADRGFGQKEEEGTCFFFSSMYKTSSCDSFLYTHLSEGAYAGHLIYIRPNPGGPAGQVTPQRTPRKYALLFHRTCSATLAQLSFQTNALRCASV